jgi:hypothetical protein
MKQAGDDYVTCERDRVMEAKPLEGLVLQAIIFLGAKENSRDYGGSYIQCCVKSSTEEVSHR